MSYRPPEKTSYGGDNELTDDTWSQANQQSAPGYQSSPSFGGQAAMSANRQHQLPNPGFNVAPNAGAEPLTPAVVAKAVSQEDILFMRGWQRDGFIFRVIPLTVIGTSALYVYNMKKDRPQKLGRFLLVSLAAYVIGKFSYIGELKRRAAESRSNTPYMQALRKVFKVPFVDTSTESFDGDNTGGYGNLAGNDSTNWNAAGLSGGLMSSGSDGIGQTTYQAPGPAIGQAYQDINYQPTFEQDNFDSPKEGKISYDELRARNRGYIKS